MLMCGIDEAGRGPVLGPLVIAGAAASEEDIKKIEYIGVQDSKLLSPERRVELFKKLLVMLEGYKILTIHPEEIDENLESDESNLNILEAVKSAEIINNLKPGHCQIDLCDRNRDRYESYIRAKLESQDVQLTLEYKADVKYPLVSAASILAKVTRDNYIEMLKRQVGQDIGSGYPSDPTTQKFLERNWNNPNIRFFRKSWAAWKNMKAKKQQKSLFEY